MNTIRVYFSINQNGNVSNTIHSTLTVNKDTENALIRDQHNNHGAYLCEMIERYCFSDIQNVMQTGVPFTIVNPHIAG